MLRSAKHSTDKKKNSISKNEKKATKSSIRRNMSSKKEIKRDVANNLTLEEVHLIIKRCADEIRFRGLHEVDIFKPLNIGDSVDEVRKLLKHLLKDNRTEYEDVIRSYNIHAVVSAMKWALRRCDTILVPYQYYEEFVKYEQEWDYDPSKGSFKKFSDYLPKQNREILCELFELCAQVTAESHINKMSDERIVKTIALCILGNKDKGYTSFDTAYDDWTKYSAACHHLFLAYLREKVDLNPRLTRLLDNYVEYRKTITSTFFQFPESKSDSKKGNRPRKQSIVTFAETTEIKTTATTATATASTSTTRPVSILRVTRQIPTTKTETKRQTRSFTTLLPDMMDSMKRKTIIRPSTMMTADEKKSAEEMWEEFQTNGITSMSDDFLKLFFSLEDRAKNISICSSVSEKQWTQFSRKGFKSVYLEPLPDKLENISESSEGGLSEGNNSSSTDFNNKEQSSNQEISLTRNDSGVSMRQTVVWDDFSQKGFRNSVDNVSNSLTLTSIESPRSDISSDDKNKNNSNLQIEEKEKSMSQVISLIKKKSINGGKKIVKFGSLRKPRRARSFESTQSTPDFSNDKEEDWEDWDIIDRAQDLPITTHLAIETVDEIFPYVWMETTAAADGDKWGDWVFIEPKKGLINECEWVMIEEESQVFNEWDVPTTKTVTRRRKMSAFSTFSIPWVRGNGNGKSRPVSKVTSRMSRMSRMSKYSMASSVMPTLPAVWAMFDRSRPDDNVVPTNYKFKNRPKDPKSFAYQASQVRASIMQTGFDDDGARTTLQYEEEYAEGEYYEDADYDYENDPTGENGYYGYSSDPGYYGHYNEYDEYQEEYYDEEDYDQDYNGQYYNEQGYNEQDYNEQYYNEEDYYQGQGENDYAYSEYSEYTEEVVEEKYTIPTPGSFVAQRQMVLQGELPALQALPKRTFQGLSHESKYNNSKLFPMQSSERLTYQRPSVIKA
ncbi:hypothetical protein RclHR1_00180009 [Rhizophagus clarus]|uniref:Rho GTPase-activating protein n=1 Tax=Rhizophagus clarus TaxID=94130 RepID=A0A2Z6R1N5_9GLOM|nr:hypothetical protein RclHR1_00180009 [Rhizophagus clarus]GES73034.1 Rho GTPase-activating protein [Rhizophagus clarus]